MFSPIDILKFKKNSNNDIFEIKKINEFYKKNFIEISIYKNKTYFSYGFKIKIENLIRQKTPLDFIYFSESECLSKAKNEIKKICFQNRKAKKILIENFTTILYNQLELF
ncbi:hypothetical protein [Treponema pedis]|uniref:hypothetical protein n=1 Tax=Treponema pedis TaxID=409322 RepID=UPI0003FFA14F